MLVKGATEGNINTLTPYLTIPVYDDVTIDRAMYYGTVVTEVHTMWYLNR